MHTVIVPPPPPEPKLWRISMPHNRSRRHSSADAPRVPTSATSIPYVIQHTAYNMLLVRWKPERCLPANLSSPLAISHLRVRFVHHLSTLKYSTVKNPSTHTKHGNVDRPKTEEPVRCLWSSAVPYLELSLQRSQPASGHPPSSYLQRRQRTEK